MTRTEGIRGLYRGTSLALFGVSNGALQFMLYEEMKKWGFARKHEQMLRDNETLTPEKDRLVRVSTHLPVLRKYIIHLVQSILYNHVWSIKVDGSSGHLSLSGRSSKNTGMFRNIVFPQGLTST